MSAVDHTEAARVAELEKALRLMLDADLYADAEGIWRFDGSDTDSGKEAVTLARLALALTPEAAKESDR